MSLFLFHIKKMMNNRAFFSYTCLVLMPRRQNEEYQYTVRRILQEELFNLKVNDPGQNV